MKKHDIRYFALLMLFVIILSLLVSCNEDNELMNSTGILADRNVISSIRQEISDKENDLLAAPGDVFWTESGALWHGSRACSYLANSKTVYHGTLDEAKGLGKERACDRCGGGGGSIYDSIEDDEVLEGDVFFTEMGSVWHSREDCSILLNGEKVYHANRALALSLGKTDGCTECGE